MTERCYECNHLRRLRSVRRSLTLIQPRLVHPLMADRFINIWNSLSVYLIIGLECFSRSALYVITCITVLNETHEILTYYIDFLRQPDRCLLIWVAGCVGRRQTVPSDRRRTTLSTWRVWRLNIDGMLTYVHLQINAITKSVSWVKSVSYTHLTLPTKRIV